MTNQDRNVFGDDREFQMVENIERLFRVESNLNCYTMN